MTWYFRPNHNGATAEHKANWESEKDYTFTDCRAAGAFAQDEYLEVACTDAIPGYDVCKADVDGTECDQNGEKIQVIDGEAKIVACQQGESTVTSGFRSNFRFWTFVKFNTFLNGQTAQLNVDHVVLASE